MARKRLGKKSTEECPKGCRGRLIGPDKYCDCIEKKLPTKRGGRKSVALQFTDKIEAYPNQEEYYRSSNEDPVEKIERALKHFGLAEYEVQLLIARFVEEKTLKEIKEEQGWLNTGSVLYHIKEALRKLKERGFGYEWS